MRPTRFNLRLRAVAWKTFEGWEDQARALAAHKAVAWPPDDRKDK